MGVIEIYDQYWLKLKEIKIKNMRFFFHRVDREFEMLQKFAKSMMVQLFVDKEIQTNTVHICLIPMSYGRACIVHE